MCGKEKKKRERKIRFETKSLSHPLTEEIRLQIFESPHGMVKP